MPRVIAGEAKGLPLAAPAGEATRPTADRTKEALFSSLEGRLSDAEVLDLCAGSGQLGIEALSRGAASATAVEQSRQACRIIRENYKKCGFDKKLRLLPADLGRALRQLAAEERRFDLVFFDPPYKEVSRLLPMVDRMLASGLLAEDGLLILEESSRDARPHEGLKLKCFKSRRYGAALLSYFCHEA